MTTLKINQIVKYSNGNSSVYEGKVVAISANNYYTVIDPKDKSEYELWIAGYAVGSYIHISQLK